METLDWTEENQKQCSLQAMKLNYCSFQGFSVDFTYLFKEVPLGKHCGESGRGLRDGLTPFLRHIQVIFTLLPPLIIHFVLCLPWLELSISLVWKVQDITCLIKNIDSMFLHRECQTRPLCTLYCTLHMQTQYSPSLILNIKISQLRPNLC